jgi:ubiquinone/menaquinone biosynthesis C-methylase UbiE
MITPLHHDLLTLAPKGRERDFLCRVYANGLDQYRRRIEAIDFTGLGTVLDAGAGMGQWSICLSECNEHVIAMEPSAHRSHIIQQAAHFFERKNMTCVRGSMDALPFATESLDCVFAYSVIYLTNWRQSLAECVRVLRPGGLIYLNANGLGWLLNLLNKGGKASHDFSPRRHALCSLIKTASRGLICQKADWALSPNTLAQILINYGLQDIRYAGDGKLITKKDSSGQPFFSSHYAGLWNVFELLAKKE